MSKGDDPPTGVGCGRETDETVRRLETVSLRSHCTRWVVRQPFSSVNVECRRDLHSILWKGEFEVIPRVKGSKGGYQNIMRPIVPQTKEATYQDPSIVI